jgi:hypothetical protein
MAVGVFSNRTELEGYIDMISGTNVQYLTVSSHGGDHPDLGKYLSMRGSSISFVRDGRLFHADGVMKESTLRGIIGTKAPGVQPYMNHCLPAQYTHWIRALHWNLDRLGLPNQYDGR